MSPILHAWNARSYGGRQGTAIESLGSREGILASREANIYYIASREAILASREGIVASREANTYYIASREAILASREARGGGWRIRARSGRTPEDSDPGRRGLGGFNVLEDSQSPGKQREPNGAQQAKD